MNKEVLEFAKNLYENQIDIDEEIAELVDECFEELI